jgi:hypothetical protein
MVRDKLLRKVVLFESIKKSVVESDINATHQNIFENNFKYIGSRIWTDSKGGKLCWCGSVEFEANYSEATGKQLVSDRDKDIIKLREFSLNLNNTLSEIGYLGAKAFVLQNQLDIPIDIPYMDILSSIEAKYNFNKNTPISDFSPDVDVVEVNIKIDNNED